MTPFWRAVFVWNLGIWFVLVAAGLWYWHVEQQQAAADRRMKRHVEDL